MYENIEVMKLIDKMRIDCKLSVAQLTDGITSTRNYSRLLSGDTSLTFENLVLMLKKLSIPIYEFGNLLANQYIYQYQEEMYFFDYVADEMYETAYQYYLENPSLVHPKGLLAKKSIPMAIRLMEYKLDKITLSQLRLYAQSMIHLEELLKNKVLFRDDILSLSLFVKFCNRKENELIVQLMHKILIERSIRIMTGYVEVDSLILYKMTLKCIFAKPEMTEYDHEDFREVASMALDYFRRARMRVSDLEFLKLLYDYNKQNHQRNDLVVYYYVLSVLATYNEEVSNTLKQELSEEDKQIYLHYLKDSKIVKAPMYEGIINEKYL